MVVCVTLSVEYHLANHFSLVLAMFTGFSNRLSSDWIANIAAFTVINDSVKKNLFAFITFLLTFVFLTNFLVDWIWIYD